MNRILYLIGEGFKNIFKHGFMSFATVTIIIACLIIMGSVSLVSVNIDKLISDLEDQNEIIAFVNEDYTDEQAKALSSQVNAIDNIASAEFVNREQAMENFMGNYDEELMEGVDASVFRNRFVIQLVDIADMAKTQSDLLEINGIDKVNAHTDYADSFVKVRNIMSVISMVLIVVLIFISFFIMSNTIKLATFSRREEIGIMKMIGASNAFIRMPFIIEGLILGLLGAVIGFFIMWGVYDAVTGQLVQAMTGSFLNVVPFENVKLYIGGFYLAVGGVVGLFGGVNAIRNYLKV